MDYRRLSGRLTAALILTTALCLTSCRGSRTATLTRGSETRSETTRVETRVTDSVHILDSVRVHTAADTVYLTRWRECWRERTVHDTVRVYLTDTVRETHTVERTVEVPAKGGGAGWAAALALLAAITIYTLVKTLLNKH